MKDTIQILQEQVECSLCQGTSKYLIESCSINNVLSLVGSKWVLPIVIEVKLRKKIRFNDLQKLLEPISAKILSKRLNMLKGKGIIKKDITSIMPVPRTMYSLTKKGEKFIECVIPLLEFEEKCETNNCGIAKKLKEELKTSKPNQNCFLHV